MVICLSWYFSYINCYIDCISWAIWVSYDNFRFLLTWCWCVNWSVKLKLSSFWKFIFVCNTICRIWLSTFWYFNVLALWFEDFRLWCISICYINSYVYCICWAIWVSYDNFRFLLTWCWCVNWSVKLKLSSFWKFIFVCNTICCIWFCTFRHFNVLSFWFMLISLSWYFSYVNCYINCIGWSIWVSYNNFRFLLTWCWRINWSVKLKLGSFWKFVFVCNTICCI